MLSLLDEALGALGAGNGDFTFAFGNPDGLPAPGAGVVTVFLIPELIHKAQIPAVFLVALVGVSGEGSEIGPEQQGKGAHRQDHVHQGIADKQRNQTENNAYTQDGVIEFIIAVAASHKPCEPGIEFNGKIMKEVTESIHTEGSPWGLEY